MYDDKKVGRTIHLPQSMWDHIDERRKIVTRSRSNEIEHSMKTLWEMEQKGNNEALAMAEQSASNQTELQPSGSDETS